MENVIYSIEKIMKESEPVFKKYNIIEASIFGSYAKNNAREDSDIDFLIKPPINFSLFDMYSLEEELRNLFNKNIDLVSSNIYTRDMDKEVSDDGIKAKKIIYKQILDERRVIYG